MKRQIFLFSHCLYIYCLLQIEKHLIIYGLLLAIRFSNLLVLQTGYLHPDEFFQTLEPATVRHFGMNSSHLSWEFDNDKRPLRSLTGQWFFVDLPIIIYKTLFGENSYSYSTHVIGPVRFFLALTTLLIDFMLMKMFNFNTVLIYSSMAFGNLLFTTRSLSNSMENFLFISFLYLTDFNKSKLEYLEGSLLSVSLHSIGISLVSVLGLFIRPTFVIFAMYPVILFLNKLIVSNINVQRKYAHLSHLLLFASTFFLAIIKEDTRVFNEIIWKHTSETSLIVTPLNFYHYNSNQTAIAKDHGSHCLLTTIFHVSFHIINPLVTFIIIRSTFNHQNSRIILSCLIPIIIFSTISHQEARFIMPVLSLIASLLSTAHSESSQSVRNVISVLWTVQNLVLFIFYGYLHQAGLVKFLISQAFENNKTLYIFQNTYMPPRGFLLNRTVIDLAGCQDCFLKHLDSIKSENLVKYVLPCILSPNVALKFTNFTEYRPFLNTEIFDKFSRNNSKDFLSLCIYQKF